MKLFLVLGTLLFSIMTAAFTIACSAAPDLTTASSPAPVGLKTTPSPNLPSSSPGVTANTAELRTPTSSPRPSVSDIPEELGAAFDRTKAATKIRYEIASTATFTVNGISRSQPGISAKGEGADGNQHIILSGVMNATGQITSFEFILLDGETYIKGLAGIPGVDPTLWYKFPPELGNITGDAPTARSLLADLNPDDFSKGGFSVTGVETLDGQSCHIWTAQNNRLADDFGGIANDQDVERELKQIENAEFKLWTCPDGYMHQMSGFVQGHDPDRPSDKATVELKFHMFDFGQTINIVAPPDARPFEVPGRNGTPTP